MAASIAPGLHVQDSGNRVKPLGFFASSIGKKVVMAVTGLVLFGFVIVHMLGNLQVYLGPEALNDYAEALRQPRARCSGRARWRCWSRSACTSGRRGR